MKFIIDDENETIWNWKVIQKISIKTTDAGFRVIAETICNQIIGLGFFSTFKKAQRFLIKLQKEIG